MSWQPEVKTRRTGHLWRQFVTYAKQNGISLEHEDDAKPWWNCFLQGAECEIDRVEIMINPDL